MNLTNFLKRTDAITAQYSAAQLVSFIHEIGRILPEEHRENFLKRLKAAGTDIEESSNKDQLDKDRLKDSDFNKQYQLIRNNLKAIDSQEIAIEGILNEEYDDWYHDSSEEYYYEDNSGISDMLARACDFIHASMDMERYKEGCKVGNQLFSMEILCTNDYGGEEFSIQDMVHNKLLQCNLEQVILDTLYCAYFAVSLKKRPEVLYEIIANAGKGEITLEAVMQHGDEELPDFQDFLILWITYLGAKTGRDADRLIAEAVGLLNDVSSAAGYAEKFAAVHPGLYLYLLENEKSADLNVMVSMGFQAMRIVPKQYIVRSRAALKTAEYVIEAEENRSILDKQSLLQKCYFAAYESDTSALNYIRVLLNGYDTKQKREELHNVFAAVSVQKSGSTYGMSTSSGLGSEREENKPDSNMIILLRFLDGQFADVLAESLNKPEALGWSGTFMKQGIALYLLYLHEGRWMDKGMNAMAGIAKSAMGFSAERYQKGAAGFNCLNENELFYDLFSKWKSIVQMEPDVRNHAMTRITCLIERRTEGIMNANRRNYYGECAAYIAALGEVQESLGERGVKQRLMTSYKNKYSRRSAFRAEMKNYGWKDIKGRS